GGAICLRPKGLPGARRWLPTTVSALSLSNPCSPCEPNSRRPPTPKNNPTGNGLLQRRRAVAHHRCAPSQTSDAAPQHRPARRHARPTGSGLARLPEGHDTTPLLRMLPCVDQVVAEVDILAARLAVTDVGVVGRLEVGPGFITHEFKPGKPGFPCAFSTPFNLWITHQGEPVRIEGRCQFLK